MHWALRTLFFPLHIKHYSSGLLLKLSNRLMASRRAIQPSRASACFGSRCARAALQTTNLCHLHQNNYREINTPFDHFHSDLIWSQAVRAHGWEMIKSPRLMEPIAAVCDGRFTDAPHFGLCLLFGCACLEGQIWFWICWACNCAAVRWRWKQGRWFRGRYGGSIGYSAYPSTHFYISLAWRQTAAEIWLASIIKTDIFNPPILGTASELWAALMPGKSPLFWQIVDITDISCLDICVFCDME